jgi:methylphosphotriester-DNA--protein-cysteine methyltransferase
MRGKIRFSIILGCLLIFVPLTLFAEDDKYVASKFSIQYHLSTCKKARRIQEQNKVTFQSAEEAVKAGHIPCSFCKPPTKD